MNRLLNSIRTFLRWWRRELSEFLPGAQNLDGIRPGRRFVLSLEPHQVRLLHENAGKCETVGQAAAEGLDGVIELLPKTASSPKVPVGLRLSADYCFARTVELPVGLESDYRRILELDMERATPIRAGNVLTAHYVPSESTVAKGKRAVRHLVVKRNTLEPFLAYLRAMDRRPAFVDCWDEVGQTPLPVNFMVQDEARDRSSASVPALAGIAVVLTLTALAIFWFRHQTALAELGEHVSRARVDAAEVRLAFDTAQQANDQLAALNQLLRARVSMAAIIDELTKILPDGAWISDLRIEDNQVEFTGYASSAAALVPILEKSPMFQNAGLTSPVVFDNEQNRERFSLRVGLTGPAEQRAGVARGEGERS